MKYISYLVQKDDTVSELAQRYKSSVGEIRKLNQSIFDSRKKDVDLIFTGETLRIIDRRPAPPPPKTIAQKGTVVYLDNKKYPPPQKVEIQTFIDSVADACTITYPVSYENKEFQSILNPFEKIIEIRVYHDRVLLFTGDLEVVKVDITKEGAITTLAARSGTRILDKSKVPPAFKKEHKDITLYHFIRNLISPFGFKCKSFKSAAIKKIVIRDSESVFSVIARLSKEQNIFITNDIDNNLEAIELTANAESVYSFDINSQSVAMLGVDSVSLEHNTTEVFGTYIQRFKGATAKSAKEVKYQNKDYTEPSYTYVSSEDEQVNTTKIKKQIARAMSNSLTQTIPYPAITNKNTSKPWQCAQVIDLTCFQAGIRAKTKYVITELNTLIDGKKTADNTAYKTT